MNKKTDYIYRKQQSTIDPLTTKTLQPRLPSSPTTQHQKSLVQILKKTIQKGEIL